MDARTGSTPSTSGEAREGAPAANRGARRRGLFTLLAIAIVVAAVVFALYWFLLGARHVTTDDAYVQADVAQVTPLVSGPVIAAPVSETQAVRKGDILVVIDPADFRLTLAQANAALGQAQRKVQGYFADTEAQAATTKARAADIDRSRAQLASARADLARARVDLARRQALAASGAVSGDELTAAQNRFDQTRDAVLSGQAAVAQSLANRATAVGQQRAASVLVAGAGLEGNPEVALARAKAQQAQLDLERTVVRAPMDGIIARNVVEVGQRVQAGAQLMTVVPIQSAYVNANFKEAQLRRMRIGQAAILTSDLYGGAVKFHGRVVGLAGGTGSAFAVIPAQNATGNWIKVVQRLPVRIALDRAELARRPLRVGLSMKVDIDTSR
ncbi:MAG TPA: HlyD family efflux transporter periplasmic adaptor subunit [Caulobacteraceae bacterium]